MKSLKFLVVYLLLLSAMSVQAQDSLNVRRLGSIPYWDDANAVSAVDTLAYVTTASSGLRIVDISDPASPVEVGCYDTPGYEPISK
ncbi:hypothetical protein KKH27_02360 [bacterium]|nr:hypothetical protein [bacterium]MBU1984656.1 hypothetical protein [bacterium]